MRLDIGVLGVEEFFSPLDSQVFHLIYIFATAVVTPLGIAFGVFAG